MANLLNLKRRIKTAQNVSKTTRAMQMIAASKLKRAQEATFSARPYVDKLTLITSDISNKIDTEKKINYMKLMSNTNKKLMVIITPDKGLCGGLITNLAKELLIFYKDNKNVIFITIGKKAKNITGFTEAETIAKFDFGTTLPSYDSVFPVMKIIDDYFLNKKVMDVYILNSSFQNIFLQKAVIKKLLPVSFEQEKTQKANQVIFEPPAEEMLPGLIRHYLEMNLYHSFLEAYLSEQAARMLAMQNATNNAKDIIEELRLLYNKSRQEKITNEILDISGGSFING